MPNMGEEILLEFHRRLNEEFPKEPEMVQCVMDSFRSNHLAEKLNTINIFIDPERLKSEITPYIEEAKLKCSPGFFRTPLGVIATVALILLIASIAFCFVKKLRQR